MILVDYRDGSKELIAPLKKAGLPVRESDLPAGDVAFAGRGVKGAPLMIGIEYKKLPDLAQSLRTNRINEQLKKMRDIEQDGFDHCWLFIEGELSYDGMGRLTRRVGKKLWKPIPGSVNHAELIKRVYVLALCGGLHPWWTKHQRDTVKHIEFLYRVYTDKDLDKHKSHLGMFEPASLEPVSQFERTIRSLPGCGPQVAKAAEYEFVNLKRAFNASLNQWAKLETKDDQGKTRKVGSATAAKIIKAITHDHIPF